MQDAGSHVRELAQFAVGDGADRLRIADDARVCHQEAGDVGPVFIEIRVQALGQDRTGDVAAASGHDADASIRSAAVKARHDEGLVVAGDALQALLAEVVVDAAVIAETDHVLGIYESIT